MEEDSVRKEVLYWLREKGFSIPKEEDVDTLKDRAWDFLDEGINENLENWAEEEDITLKMEKAKQVV